jgi:hypothetical protein
MKLPAVAIAAACAARIAIGLHPAVAARARLERTGCGPFYFCDSRVDRSIESHVAELGVLRGIRGDGLLAPWLEDMFNRASGKSRSTRAANRWQWSGAHFDARESSGNFLFCALPRRFRRQCKRTRHRIKNAARISTNPTAACHS